MCVESWCLNVFIFLVINLIFMPYKELRIDNNLLTLSCFICPL